MSRMLLAAFLVGGLVSCSEETVYSALHVTITADDGAGIDTLILEVRRVDGNALQLFDGADATLHRREIKNVSLPYSVKLSPGSQVKGTAWLVVFGTRGGNTVAVWSGRVNLDAQEEVSAHLSVPDTSCDADKDGFADCSVAGCCTDGAVSDCDDSQPAVSPLATLPTCIPCTETADLNCDGTPDPCNDPDGDLVPACEGDCKPDDGSVHPGATEVCDGEDNDCDGQTDEGLPDLDDDGTCDDQDDDIDGDGTPNAEDCAPTDPDINPDAIEVCDGVDNNCVDGIDEAAECQDWLGDWDGDGKVGADDCNPLDSRFFVGSTWPVCCQSADYASATAADALAECDFDCSGQANFCAAGDDDGDGVVDLTECSAGQGDPTIYPGAIEICGDGIDQDCQGGDIACDDQDQDDDGYRADVDCNDDDNSIHPGAEDPCDGIDNNCNGFVDEGNPGAAGACPHPTQNTGECALESNYGVQVCAHGLAAAPEWADDQVSGSVGVICIDFHMPPDSESACDNLDEDCDGETDEDFSVDLITADGTLAAHVKGDACGVGECAGSTVVCAPEEASKLRCPGFDSAQSELCDNLDNDCDAVTDEFSFPLAMTTCLQAGECGANAADVVTHCSGGVWSCDYDFASYEAGTEASCDGLDNDCDGTTDEDLTYNGIQFGAPCSGIGECGAAAAPIGTVECSTGGPVATCSTNPDGSNPQVGLEVCDGLDNNCDGQTDEESARAVDDPQYQKTETICDGYDNDCDSEVDELSTVIPPATLVCKTAGICAPHAEVLEQCLGADGWNCVYTPVSGYVEDEGAGLCDNLDNDCDGTTDEAYVEGEVADFLGKVCSRGAHPDCTNTGAFICNGSGDGTLCSVTGKVAMTLCDDGDATTKNDVCSGGDGSDCAGTFYECPDEFTCTDDVQVGDGTCTHPIQDGNCLIGGVCYVSGAQNPQNVCQLCDPESSKTGWTDRPENTTCDDGNSCTEDDRCDATAQCKGSGIDCSDDLACTIDTCTKQNEANPKCDSTQLMANTCLIDGVCYSANEARDGFPCQICAPATSTTTWTNRANGSLCSDGLKCTLSDTCDAGLCVGEQNDCDDGNECSADSCSEAVGGDGCVNQPLDGVACTADAFACTADLCVAGQCSHPIDDGACLIGGTCYADGAVNPADQCEECAAGDQQTLWTGSSPETSCNDGNACTENDVCGPLGACGGTPLDCNDGKSCTLDSCSAGECVNEIVFGACLIDGACISANTTNGANQCEQCSPEMSATAWSPKSNGTACDADSNGCTQSDSCQTGVCTPGAAPNCASVADECNAGTCDSTGPNSYDCVKQPLDSGTACSGDGIDCTPDVCDGAGTCTHEMPESTCIINDVCYADGAVNPMNPCESCQTGVSMNSWSLLAAGASCTDDGKSCTQDVCDGAGTCTHEPVDGTCFIGGTCYDADAPSPSNECRACVPADSQTSFTALGTSVSCTDDGIECTLDRCDAGTCSHPAVADDTPCTDDGEACTQNVCKGGSCEHPPVPGNPACTDDGNECTDDVCSGGACTHPNLSDATSCNDGDDCTVADLCDGAGGCSGTAIVCNSPGECETGGACVGGLCEYDPETAGTPCDDGNNCTVGDSCDGAGTCDAGGDDPCPPGSDTGCELSGTCDDGNCTPVFAPDTTDCDDGDACTDTDKCAGDSATCEGAPVLCAPPANPCRVAMCDPETGGCAQMDAPDGTPCDDGFECTNDTTCTAGVCGNPTSIVADTCFIAGECFDTGDYKPREDGIGDRFTCLTCNPESDDTDWSPEPNNTPCYDGFEAKAGVGVCTLGACGAGPNTGVCENWISPQAESSPTACCDGLDNNCNGDTDCGDGFCNTNDVCDGATDDTCTNPPGG